MWAAAAVVVVLVILCAGLLGPPGAPLSPGYWLACTVDTPARTYARSGGGLDRAARAALTRATARGAPADHLLAATILHRSAGRQCAAPRPWVAAAAERYYLSAAEAADR